MKHRSVFFVLTSLLSCLYGGNLHSQAAVGMTQEIGVVAGPVALLSDYGLRNNFSTNIGNTGKGVGLVYYVHFAHTGGCDCRNMRPYFRDHFRIRAELDYHKTSLRHYGKILRSNNPDAALLRAMKGASEIFELGGHLEYFPLSIRSFTAFAYPFAPFVSLGINYVGYSPSAHSSLGAIEEHLFPSFSGGLKLKDGSTWSIGFGGGVRYKLTRSSDLVANLQWRYYESDWLDGLNHDQPQNKFNEMMFWINAGYIYYVRF